MRLVKPRKPRPGRYQRQLNKRGGGGGGGRGGGGAGTAT